MSGRGYLRAVREGRYGRDWKAFRRQLIGERGNRCERCGNPPTEKHVLTIHHIDFNPENRQPENLLVLCSKCHLAVQRGVKPGQLRLF